jgi:hypothetical protein
LLPPGHYVARARVTRQDQAAGVVSRPFAILPHDPKSGAPPLITLPTAIIAGPPNFDKAVALRPDVIGSVLDLIEQKSPSLKLALARARRGMFHAAAVQALAPNAR